MSAEVLCAAESFSLEETTKAAGLLDSLKVFRQLLAFVAALGAKLGLTADEIKKIGAVVLAYFSHPTIEGLTAIFDAFVGAIGDPAAPKAQAFDLAMILKLIQLLFSLFHKTTPAPAGIEALWSVDQKRRTLLGQEKSLQAQLAALTQRLALVQAQLAVLPAA